MRIRNVLFFTILSLITVFYYYKNTTIKDDFKHQKSGFYELLNETEKEKIDELNEITSKSENKIVKNLRFLDTNNDSFLLSELVGNKTKVIFRFSDSHCSYCIEHAMEYFEKKEKEIGAYDLIMAGNFANRHSHSIYTRLNPAIRQKIYNCTESFELPVDSLSLPYIIIINESLETENIFVPLKEVPKRTGEFFKKLDESLFINN